MPLDLTRLTIVEAARLIEKKALSPVELVGASLERIQRLNPKLNAYLTVMADSAMQAAQQAEREIQQGRYRGPLHGIPVSLKDLYYTRGVRTTAGSRIMADFVPDYDATVTTRLREAGAVIVGKAHMHEFAMGATTNNPHYGPCHNPWKLDRIPGGSSGGSGAAIAARTDLASLGSDTGGSIRLPAAVCGVVGLKPTYGRVSRHGVVPLSWSLDHAGPLTRTAADAALVLQAIAGHDPKDSSSADIPVSDYPRALDGNIKGLRVGIPREYFWDELDPDVEQAVRRAIGVLGELGCAVEEVSLPTMPYAAAAGSLISWAEAATFHERWLRTRAGDYGVDVRNRLEQASMELAVHYIKAQRVRRQITEELVKALQRVDVLVAPTAPIPAPRIGATTIQVRGVSTDVLLLLSKLTRPFNLSGQPAVSVPCGFSRDGLPVAFQVAGRHFDEATVLKVADAYQRATDWHARVPPLAG
ncbi:MAG: Asp-tRNA(Asn)/Glu-tRNA(Gln) amidotransferase subunit GatA [Chloroflexi bacterium]|nr:Asp-tRNA(Asn)/Glu-tRNA(Gln) amidotransferase subunit GatA [Chloroflexota bacterium]